MSSRVAHKILHYLGDGRPMLEFVSFREAEVNITVVRRNFSREGQPRDFTHPFQVVYNAMLMNVRKKLHLFFTTKKMPHITATVTKIALLWQQRLGILRKYTQKTLCRFSKQGTPFQKSIAVVFN